jgi:hypothetical protein
MIRRAQTTASPMAAAARGDNPGVIDSVLSLRPRKSAKRSTTACQSHDQILSAKAISRIAVHGSLLVNRSNQFGHRFTVHLRSGAVTFPCLLLLPRLRCRNLDAGVSSWTPGQDSPSMEEI